MATVLEEVVAAAGAVGELLQRGAHDRRGRGVDRVGRLARLEEDVGVLRGAAQHRAVGAEAALAMPRHGGLVDDRAHHVVAQLIDLGDLVRGAKAVEEMHEGQARFEARRLRHQRHVVGRLHRLRGEHRPAGVARRHHVAVVGEDRQRVGRHRARRHVDHAGRQLAGDLEHVGQHQEQPLRRGEGGRQRARLQRAVDGTGGAALTLHLDDMRDLTPEVALALSGPGVGQLPHRRGGRDRVDRHDLVGHVGDVGCGFVAVDDSGAASHVFSCATGSV